MPLPQEEDDTIGFSHEDTLAELFKPSLKPGLRTEEELATQFPRQRKDLKCGDCGSPLVLKDGKFGIFYGCVMYRENGCRGSLNCHKVTSEPLGFPVDSVTRQLRKEAHALFDQLWQANARSQPGAAMMRREEAYKWMAKHLGLSESDAHIAKLDAAGCRRLIATVDRYLNPPDRFGRQDPF